ncbi:AI-2E family transporter [Bradyrhizobium japonicum]|uniref:AI-2E family transporter n=1 Tax=Bradyrhizobium japonicum TaxID=375 RepID=UPI0005763EE0|nr:AI-2E family transporter [Bradyrhizobium japonicum]UQD98864.1 AI-2E family transporter [Bradyrhizobium japonicum]WLB18759.1 AI-2E family transporter [Bradyrhizobium japonicum]
MEDGGDPLVSLSMLPQELPTSPGQDAGASESGALPTQAVDNVEMPLPSSAQTFFLGGLLTLAVLAAVYVASSIILPVVLAFVLQLILQPAVDLLERIGLPRAVGALLAILLVVGALVGFVAALSVPAASWAEKLPDGLPRLETHLVVLKRPIEALQKVVQQAEHVADSPGKKEPTVSVRRDLGLTGVLFAGTRAVLDGLFTTVLVLYFLLVAGDIFLRRIVEVLPNFADKRQAVDIFQQIEADISAYLLTITAMNAAVGIATAAAMYLCGLGDPLLWGAAAFLLNYVPILGPLLGTVIFLLAGMLSFDSLWWALLPAILYFCIHLAEGETLTPMLLARRFTLNPVLIILSLVFWFWMWGVPGAILAVPMLAILKIVSDRVRPLKALGHVLEG